MWLMIKFAGIGRRKNCDLEMGSSGGNLGVLKNFRDF